MREAVWIATRAGVPFHMAMNLPADYRLSNRQRTALSIIASEFEGRKFNFGSWKFEGKA